MRQILTYSASVLWSAASFSARELAKRGVLKSVRLDSRVISVGNLQAGGTGKTPLVSWIANEAADRGMQVGILIRGYQSRWEKTGGIILPADQGGGGIVDPELSGDEAALLHELCPRATIGVGADRVLQYRKMVEALEQKKDRALDLVILDDGFQNWQIHKDLNIVNLTSFQPWEKVFRDLPGKVREADLAVWTRGDQRPIHLEVPLIRVQFKLPVSLTDQPIWLVSGVGDNSSVKKMAVEHGYRIDKHLSYPDHFRYDSATVIEILKQASQGACRVALTGKDWVKWKSLGIPQSEVLVLEPELVFLEGRETWQSLLWGGAS